MEAVRSLVWPLRSLLDARDPEAVLHAAEAEADGQTDRHELPREHLPHEGAHEAELVGVLPPARCSILNVLCSRPRHQVQRHLGGPDHPVAQPARLPGRISPLEQGLQRKERDRRVAPEPRRPVHRTREDPLALLQLLRRPRGGQDPVIAQPPWAPHLGGRPQPPRSSPCIVGRQLVQEERVPRREADLHEGLLRQPDLPLVAPRLVLGRREAVRHRAPLLRPRQRRQLA
mmetsp:Transcript_6708/g.23127  ORF Transcript_6708/g.23127 Transcript_6708/m.23127 type:complete len:230 (-) Transcript_6708:56-745(-)